MKNQFLRAGFSIFLIFVTLAAFSQKKEERDVESFSGISLSISGDLLLTQGNPQQVVIEAEENSLGKIVTEVKDGVLKIKREKGWRQNLKNVTIWITVPEIDGLYLAGSGSIVAENSVNADELEIKISGSGSVKLEELKSNEVGTAISGSGNVHLVGTANELDIAISGSGGIKAGDFEVSECSARISGSGSCVV